MAFRRSSRHRSAQVRKSRFRGRLENLERRDLFAGDVVPVAPANTDVDDGSINTPAEIRDQQRDTERLGRNSIRQPRSPSASPIRVRVPNDFGSQSAAVTEFASIDGSGHNLDHEAWGSVGQTLERWTTVAYDDGLNAPTGQDRSSAREISNIVSASPGETENANGLSDLTWLFGQFIDHDIDLSESGEEVMDIEVPTGDAWFDPTATGNATISFHRTDFVVSNEGMRQQFNEITAFIDGSVIYGSDQERADALRTFSGGLLATSEGNLLPFNAVGLANAGGTSDTLFLAGDVRANENAALTAMHTVWVREHNRVATEIGNENPALSDEDIYQMARQFVTAELQAITYNEFLPALLGNGAIERYEGYDTSVNPNIASIFSTAAYRFGHSMLSPELLRLNDDGTEADEGNIALQNAFFNPGAVIENDIDSILLGASVQTAQEVDPFIVDDVRNFLFGSPGSGGFDLAALNIQRGRDHGLADYNQVRVDMGLPAVRDFSDISSNVEVQNRLEAAYNDVTSIDAWVGMLAEDHANGSTLGITATTILAEQFTRLRDGDRLYFENVFEGQQLQRLRNTSLANIIERNTSIDFDRDANVFFAGNAGISTNEDAPELIPPFAPLPPNGPTLDNPLPNEPVEPQDQSPVDQGPRDDNQAPRLRDPNDGIAPDLANDGSARDEPGGRRRGQRDSTATQDPPPIANELATDLAFSDLGAND